jgi:UDP-glucose 4-epimerase
MNILITGTDGFIGKNLKNYFKNSKHIIFSPTIKTLDLRHSEKVKRYLDNCKVDVIIHSATVLQKNKKYIDSVCEDNLRMFFNLYEFKTKNCILINLGSGSEFNRKNWIPVMKNKYLGKNIPSDGHSFSKYISARFIEKSTDETLYHLRIFGIFGKYEDYLYKFISNTIIKQLLSVPIILNQNARYHYLHIEDLCRIIEELIKVRPIDKIINVTPKDKIELVNIIKIIQKLIPNNNSVKIIKKGFGKEYTGSNEELLKFYNSFTTPEKSILELIKFYKNKLSVIKKSLYKIKKDNFLKYAKTINR